MKKVAIRLVIIECYPAEKRLVPSPGEERWMNLVATAINAAVVAGIGLILAWLGKGAFEAIDRRFEAIDRRFEAIDRRFEAVDRRFDAIDHRFEAQDQRFDRLEHRLEQRLDVVQASVDAMRSDLTQVALAVGVRRRATNA